MTTKFAAAFEAARQRAKLTQADLAMELGCTISYVSMLSRGLREPSLATLVRSAKVLHLSLDEIFGLGAHRRGARKAAA